MSPAPTTAPPAPPTVPESDKELALASEVVKQTHNYDAKLEKHCRVTYHCTRAIVAAIRELGDRIG